MIIKSSQNRTKVMDSMCSLIGLAGAIVPSMSFGGTRIVKTRIILSLLSVVGLIALTGCDSSKPTAPSGEAMASLTLGTYEGDLSSLIWIAQDRGYFADHGLKVNVKLYESGVAAANDLVSGKVDFATAADFVAACHILEGADLRIIASLCNSADAIKLVARKDHGITQIRDIRHKRIGVLRGSGGEFFLDLSLVVHNIPSEEVQKVNLQPSDQVKALAKAEIDATVTWDPFVTSIVNELGSNAAILPAQNGQGYYWLLLGTADGLKKRTRTVHDLVASLVSADTFLKKHRDEARIIVARKLGLSDLPSWERTDFEVCIDHPLTLAMEAQIRWMNPSLAKRPSDTPNLLRFLYFDALKSVQPQRIKMIY
ncbi:MAG TPA: ABC transporter substrate-binding protein [Desulfomonilaceae bacterium]|nr:ABC transporter substrate-binding protein [Desulfomonilaceae bacterium]